MTPQVQKTKPRSAEAGRFPKTLVPLSCRAAAPAEMNVCACAGISGIRSPTYERVTELVAERGVEVDAGAGGG